MKKKTILVLSSYVLVFILGIAAAFFYKSYGSYISTPEWTVPTDKDKAHEEAMITNEAIIRRFSDGNWSVMDQEEKLSAIQTIVDLEIIYLGLPHEIPVTVQKLSSETNAEYSAKERTIRISEQFLDEETDTYMILLVICHEVFHAYQFSQVYLFDSTSPVFQSLRLFDDARNYKSEIIGFFSNTSKSSWWEYKSQTMEINADSYGMSSANYYLNYYDE